MNIFNGMVKNIILPGLFLLLAPLAVMAAATGTCGTSQGSGSAMLISGTLQVSPTAPVGSIIGAEFNSTAGGMSVGGKAVITPSTTNQPPYYAVWTISKAVVSGISYNGATVYQTGYTGIGIAVWGDSYTSGPKVLLSNSTVAGTYSKPLNFAFIKTATTTATGQISPYLYSTKYLQCTGASGTTVTSPTETATSEGVVATFATSACGVNNATINVPMGDVKRTTFTGVGSTSPARSFNISLACTSKASVKLTLAPGGSGAFNATSGVVNLDAPTSGVMATGVGIQLLYNNAAEPLNTAISVGSATASSTFTVPLTARYYQTATTITPGTANATATFTMTYN